MWLCDRLLLEVSRHYWPHFAQKPLFFSLEAVSLLRYVRCELWMSLRSSGRLVCSDAQCPRQEVPPCPRASPGSITQGGCLSATACAHFHQWTPCARLWRRHYARTDRLPAGRIPASSKCPRNTFSPTFGHTVDLRSRPMYQRARNNTHGTGGGEEGGAEEKDLY